MTACRLETAVPDSSPTPDGPRPPPLWRRLAPFVVALALVVFVLARLDYAAFWKAVAGINVLAFVGAMVLFVFALLAADSFATAHVYRTAVCPVSTRQLFIIRAASYLPSLVNHHVGQAWLTYFFARVHGASVWKVAGATLLVYATNFAGLFVLMALALPRNWRAVAWLLPLSGVVAVAGVIYLLVLAARPEVLTRNKTTSVLVDVGPVGHLRALAYRMPHVVVMFIGVWLPFWFFGVDLPLADALAYIPVLMFVGALPVTPQGVGTRDVVAVELLARFAVGAPDEQRAAIAAATLSFAVMLTLVELIISPLFLRAAYGLLGRDDPDGPREA